MPGRARTKKVPSRLAPVFAGEAAEVLAGARAAHEQGNHRVAAITVVNAGIRATDAICVAAFGEHARGDDHAEALNLLRKARVDARLVNQLDFLLGLKTAWSYGVDPVKPSEFRRALRAAEQLVREATLRASPTPRAPAP